jgi:anti-sigma factor RsiW
MDASTARDCIPEYLLGTLDASQATEVEAALAASPELRAEADALGRALFALPEALEPEPLPEDAWSRLRAAVANEALGPATGSTEPTADTGARSRSRGRPRVPAMALALAASLALLAGVGAWGIRGVQERAELANQQRIISYWMRNPELRIVSLQGVGPGASIAEGAPAEVPVGIVCVLPDGRAMMLQPYAAPSGSRYVLYGVGPGGRTELGATNDRFLLFDAADLRGVQLEVEGRVDAVVAEATF